MPRAREPDGDSPDLQNSLFVWATRDKASLIIALSGRSQIISTRNSNHLTIANIKSTAPSQPRQTCMMYHSIESIICEKGGDLKDGQIERAFTHARDRCNARFRVRVFLPPGDIFQYYVEMDVWMRLFQRGGGMPEFPGVQPLQEAWDEISRLNDTITELKAGAVQDYLHIKLLESGIQNAETFHNLRSENTILKDQLIQQKINEDATIEKNSNRVLGNSLMTMANNVHGLNAKIESLENTIDRQAVEIAGLNAENAELDGNLQVVEYQTRNLVAGTEELISMNKDQGNRLSQAQNPVSKRNAIIVELNKKGRKQIKRIAALKRQILGLGAEVEAEDDEDD
ncbi:hypothetical protein DL95DRAFT_452855 [Leptodontidium sp. 2 PMI_412]|nr:hypothetical protein DL95DRAFT_452855 [Leptodontidium sp. 2 PMI_412]